MSNAVAAVLLVVGILVGAGGYYFATTNLVPSQMSATHFSSTTHSTATKPSSSCSASTPLTLKSAVWGTAIHAPSVYLSTTWSNCVSQQISFSVALKNLNVTISTYGKTSYATGRLIGCNGELTCLLSVSADGTTIVSLGIYFDTTVSPNAITVNSTGYLVAVDPSTGQTISSSVSFTT